MKIQLNTDNNIHGTAGLESYVTEKINHALKPFKDKITRIEVHLSDQNAHKTGVDDIRCKMEARIEGAQPLVVASADSLKNKAVDGAIIKLKAAVAHKLGKRSNR